MTSLEAEQPSSPEERIPKQAYREQPEGPDGGEEMQTKLFHKEAGQDAPISSEEHGKASSQFPEER